MRRPAVVRGPDLTPNLEIYKRPRQLAEVHASKPGTKSMVQRPRMRCEHTCDPADPTF